ncbi:MAG: glutamyl-tRNA reductase [Anaerolineae bacterium]|nr:glutamyl-tRNA reductase [Anaerolineae bacterium]MDW8071618.1 glutamyl-tRNA reductase [Anaerolineae bacterium]
MTSHILLVGLNHTTASVCLREKLAINGTSLPGALSQLRRMNGHEGGTLHEGVILSTCNRLEVYTVCRDAEGGYHAVVDFLCCNRRLAAEEFVPALYRKRDAEAVRHLMRVACGLDSMVMGEPQILGQVTAAYQAALAGHSCGAVLSTLFRHAIRAGKRAHAETAISRHAVTVPSVAATLAEQVVGSLRNRVVLVMGAGEMGELAVRTLIARGATSIIVANRTYDRALALARELGGEAMTFERQLEALVRADIVITATDAPHVILTRDKVAQAMAQRPERPLVIVDIAVPRDTEPTVAEVPGVRLFDIDDLQTVANGNLEARQREIPRVEAIAAEEAQAFMCWFETLEVVPTISDLRRWAEEVKTIELEKALRRLRHLDERERKVVQALAHRLVNKFLHLPTVQLKQRALEGQGHHYASAIRDLFGLGLRDCETLDPGDV